MSDEQDKNDEELRDQLHSKVTGENPPANVDGDTPHSEGAPEEESWLDRWSSLGSDDRRETFASLSRSDAEELFLSLQPNFQAELLEDRNPLEKRSWVRLLPPDDAADLVQEVQDEEKYRILSLLDDQTRREVTALLAYKEDEAGGLMSSRYVRLRPDMFVDEAISYLRAQARTQVETIYYAYVLDSDQKLLGAVSFRELFMASPRKRVREIMQTDIITLYEETPQEEVSRIFSQNDLMAIPVVDENDHIKGIVTVDDVVGVMQEEATEDIQKIGAVEALEGPYMQTSFLEMIKKRAGWLVFLFLGESLTATAMGYFQDQISQAVVLALFIPLIISSGGNSGSQASTLIIRAIALREVRLRDWWRVFFRELSAGLTLGVILGTVGLLRVLFWPARLSMYGQHYQVLAITIGISLIGVVLWGTLAGSMLPFLLRRLGADPATASAPLVATLVDVTGLIIYFSVAHALLSGILL